MNNLQNEAQDNSVVYSLNPLFHKLMFAHIYECAEKAGGDVLKTSELLLKEQNNYDDKFEHEIRISAVAHFERYSNECNSVDEVVEKIKKDISKQYFDKYPDCYKE